MCCKVTAHCVQRCPQYLHRSSWPSGVGGFVLSLILHYIDVGLLGRFSFALRSISSRVRRPAIFLDSTHQTSYRTQCLRVVSICFQNQTRGGSLSIVRRCAGALWVGLWMVWTAPAFLYLNLSKTGPGDKGVVPFRIVGYLLRMTAYVRRTIRCQWLNLR